MNLVRSHLNSLEPPVGDVSRRIFMAGGLATGFALATLPVSAQTITTDSNGLTVGEVRIPVADGSIPGYRAMPAEGGPFATVLVVQEIFGVHEHIKDICRRLAKLGCHAVAPELYARQGNVAGIKDVQEILARVVARVPDKQVVADLDATAAWARQNPGKPAGKGAPKAKGEPKPEPAAQTNSDPEKLGVIGFSWGGRIAWLYAAHNRQLAAAVAFYGKLEGERHELTPRHPLDLVGELKAPVLGLYGGADSGIPVTTVQEMQAALKKARNPSIMRVYPSAGHGFFADYRSSYRKEDAKEAWTETVTWLRRYGLAEA